MIIAITRENESLIKYVCNQLDKDVQIMSGVSNLKRFAIQEMKNLNNYSDIIIDLFGINDSESEVIDAIVALKSMYDIKITIIATEYKHGNSLLAKLFNEGIYNFITTSNIREQEKELLYCIEYGKQYKDSIRFRAIEFLNNDTNKFIIKKEYKKLKQCITVAIAGTQSHIGVTTQALAITKFLNNLQMNACYIQANKSEDIESLETFYDLDIQKSFFSYQNIDMYRKEKTVNAIELGYDFYVYDMGVLNEISDIDNFLTKDIKIIVSGSKAWEQNNLMEVFEKVGESSEINYLFNFTEDGQKEDITYNMGRLGTKTFFINYMPNPFDVRANEDKYHEIIKEYITEKSIRTEIIEIPKKKKIFQKLWRKENKKQNVYPMKRGKFI